MMCPNKSRASFLHIENSKTFVYLIIADTISMDILVSLNIKIKQTQMHQRFWHTPIADTLSTYTDCFCKLQQTFDVKMLVWNVIYCNGYWSNLNFISS